jgi:hypothetical protein
MRIFVACPYSPPPFPTYKEIYRAVERSMEMRHGYPVKFHFSDEVVSSDNLLDKIEADIKASDSCFFDLTDFNNNVCIEFGIARGMQKKLRLLHKHAPGFFSRANSHEVLLPTDLRGHDRLSYSNEQSLREGLENLVVQVMADWGPEGGNYYFRALCANILQLIGRHPRLTSSEIAARLHLETENISSTLKKLLADGTIERTSRGANGAYYLAGHRPPPANETPEAPQPPATDGRELDDDEPPPPRNRPRPRR